MTNEQYIEAIKKRHSRRAYKQKPLGAEKKAAKKADAE